MDLNQLCTAFGIDRTAAEKAIAEGNQAAERDAPWFVQALMGLGSWIAALVIIAFGGFLLVLVFDMKGGESFGVALCVLGLLFFGPGYFMLRRNSDGIFANQFGTAIAAAGQAMVAVGAGFAADSVVAAALVSIPFCILIAMVLESRTLQAMSTAWTVILGLLALGNLKFEYPLELTALGVAAGVFLTLRPPQRDLAPSAMVLLVLGPIVAILTDFRADFGVNYTFFFAGWGARAIYGALSAYLFYALWQRTEDRQAQIRIALFALAAVVLSFLLPPGGSAAIALMILAFMLGSHLLALLGILLQIYFLSKYYYDLDLTLLTKSMVLMAAGVIILGLWALMMRTRTAEQAA